MKIMICIGQLCKGGAERVVCNLANYLSKNNNVTLVVFRNTKIDYEISTDVKIIKLDNKEKEKFKLLKNMKRIIKLNKILKKEKFDVTLSFLPRPSYITLFLKKFRKNKVIVSVRNDPKMEYKSLLNKILMKWLYPLADGFVFQTEEAKQYFPENIQKKSIIILNSVNENFIIDKPYNGIRDKIIVSVGRLDEQKNQKMLIKAFSKIHYKYPKYNLIIYGEGCLRNDLEKLINDLNLEKNIFLPGIEDNIKEKLYKASLFVLPSNYEGMPNSLIEAMALGVPSISTNCPCGGPKDLINDGENGFLIDVNSEEDLVKKMDLVLSGIYDISKISKNANKIKDRINPKIINKEWENYLKKIYEKE